MNICVCCEVFIIRMLRDFNKFLSRQQTIKVGGYNTSGTLLQGGSWSMLHQKIVESRSPEIHAKYWLSNN